MIVKFIKGRLCFADKGNIGVTLNLDWFNSFENTEHSLGVIYMTIINFSREIRFKLENTILGGIIPGPREPSLHINSFLSSLLEKLTQILEGCLFREGGKVIPAFLKLAVTGISRDVPATRKFCGFISCNATKGSLSLIF